MQYFHTHTNTSNFCLNSQRNLKNINSHSRAKHFGTKKSQWIAHFGTIVQVRWFLELDFAQFHTKTVTHVLQLSGEFFSIWIYLSRCQAKNVSQFHTLPIQLAVGTHCSFVCFHSPFMVLHSITIWHCTLARIEQQHLAWFWYMKVENKCDSFAALHFHLHNEQIHIHIGFDCLWLCCYYRCCCLYFAFVVKMPQVLFGWLITIYFDTKCNNKKLNSGRR